MNKMNKKGFTLIEMLVVIAIIAVLVAIIIPTVTSSTDRASAATNAANLRAVKSEVSIALLSDKTTASGLTWAESSGTYTFSDSTPTAAFKDLATATAPSGVTFTGTFDASKGFEIAIASDKTITVKYDGLTINDWAALAE